MHHRSNIIKTILVTITSFFSGTYAMEPEKNNYPTIQSIILVCTDEKHISFASPATIPPCIQEFIRFDTLRWTKPHKTVDLAKYASKKYKNDKTVSDNMLINLNRPMIKAILNQQMDLLSWTKASCLQHLYTANYLLAPIGYTAPLAHHICKRFGAINEFVSGIASDLCTTKTLQRDEYVLENNELIIKNHKYFNSLSNFAEGIAAKGHILDDITAVKLEGLELYTLLKKEVVALIQALKNLQSLQISNTKIVRIDKGTFGSLKKDFILNLSNNLFLRRLTYFGDDWNNGICLLNGCPNLSAISKKRVVCKPKPYISFIPWWIPAGYTTVFDDKNKNKVTLVDVDKNHYTCSGAEFFLIDQSPFNSFKNFAQGLEQHGHNPEVIESIIIHAPLLEKITKTHVNQLISACKNLRYLQISHTRLTEIEDETFHALPNQFSISLSNNEELSYVPTFREGWEGLCSLHNCPHLGKQCDEELREQLGDRLKPEKTITEILEI